MHPPRCAPPPLPSSSCSFANRAPPSFRSLSDCASPTGSTSSFAPGLAPTLSRTPSPTLTSRLCPNHDCTNRSARSKSFPPLTLGIFNKHLTAVGFPHLRHAQQDVDADSDTDSEPDFGMMDNATVDSRMRQDDYQQPMCSGRIGGDIAPLMGSHEFDVVYVWPNSRYGVNFNALLRCLPATNASTAILPRLPCPLSVMQRMVFDIVHTHTFGASQDIQLLSSSSVRPGLAKSYLISAIRQLFMHVHGPRCSLHPQNERAHWDTSRRCQHPSRATMQFRRRPYSLFYET